MKTEHKIKCLLVSVGGSPEPVIKTIDEHSPENIIFFVSPESRKEIEDKIRPYASTLWKDQEIIMTPDPQDLVISVSTLHKALPKKLRDMELTFEDLYVDFTGGTKVMSAALVVGTITWPVRYSYVGGTKRTKENKGIVIGGLETVLESDNPWDILAIDSYRSVSERFNQGAFQEAENILLKEKIRVGDSLKTFFTTLAEICKIFQKWDRFDYSNPGQWGKYVNELKLQKYYSSAEWKRFIDELVICFQRLAGIHSLMRKINDKKQLLPEDNDTYNLLIVDLISNAIRTARQQNRYDDGVLRLYSAIEKLAKLRLEIVHGIKNSEANPDQIPTAIKYEFVKKYSDEKGQLKLGLAASYQVLAELKDPLGEKFKRFEKELTSVMGSRNSALLNHGWSPVRTETFNDLLAITLNFLDLKEEDIPKFPLLPEHF